MRPSFSVTSAGDMAGATDEMTVSDEGTDFRQRPGLTIWQILLVCKDEQQALFHLSVVEDLVQLCPCLVDAFPVCRIDNKDETLCASVVMPPQWSDLILPSDVLVIRCERGSVAG